MSGIIKRPLKEVTAEGAVQGIAAYGAVGILSWSTPLIVAGATAMLAWFKGRSLEWAILLGVSASVGISLAAYLVSLARSRSHSTKQDEPTNGVEAFNASQSRLALLEQELRRLQACDDEFRWLREIAENQKKAIHDYVNTDCWIIEDDLERERPFVDFQISIDSSCVYDLTAVGLRGSIDFANRPLDHPPTIANNLVNSLTVGGHGWLTVRQELSKEDVAAILNQSNQFSFNRFFIELTAAPGIDKLVLLNPHSPPDNKSLRDKYPKLKIQIKAVRSFIINMHSQPMMETPFITLDAQVENLRKRDIQIDTIRLATMLSDRNLVSSAETKDIYQNMHIAENGKRVNTKPLRNLASLPLTIVGRGRVSGCLQFFLEGFDAMEILGAEQSLSLTLTDKFGEQHTANCVISSDGKAD